MSKVSISQIINYSWVRYEKLTELINLEYKDSQATRINMYIDLYSILKPLYSSNIVIDDYSEITSCVINMCAHYRYFFRTRYNVETKIYLIWSNNVPFKNKEAYEGYNEKSAYSMKVNTKISSLIEDNFSLLETLCPYIPDVMFVRDTYEVGVIASYISQMQENIMYPNLMVTRDCYNFQLAKGKYDFKILVPYKVRYDNDTTMDKSYIVNEEFAISWYIYKLGIRQPEVEKFLPGSMLSLLMALTRCPTRNITSLKNLPRAYKDLVYMVDNNIIPLGHIYDVSKVAEVLHLNSNVLVGRYYACDIPSQLMHYNLDPSINVRNHMINLYDGDAVKQINNKYFIKYPLDLNAL